MPERKEPKLKPAEQFKRFRDAAKKAGLTDKEEEFEGAFNRIAAPPKKPNNPKQDGRT